MTISYRRLLAVCVFVFAAALFIIPHGASAATNVSGTMTSNTTWKADKGPYIVGESFVVAKNVTLTIEAGTVVKFNPNVVNSPIVLGVIKALGEKNDSDDDDEDDCDEHESSSSRTSYSNSSDKDDDDDDCDDDDKDEDSHSSSYSTATNKNSDHNDDHDDGDCDDDDSDYHSKTTSYSNSNDNDDDDCDHDDDCDDDSGSHSKTYTTSNNKDDHDDDDNDDDKDCDDDTPKASKNVIFTTLTDDSVGGDTNGDGAATTPSATGEWMLTFGETTGTAHKYTSNLAYVVIRYTKGIFLQNRDLDVDHATLEQSNLGIVVGKGSKLDIEGLVGMTTQNEILVARDGGAIAAEDITLDRAGSSNNGITLLNSSVLHLNDSTIFNVGRRDAAIALFASDAVIDELEIKDSLGEGILLFNSFTLDRPSTLSITESKIHDLGEEALLAFDNSKITMKEVAITNTKQAGLGLFDSTATVSKSSFDTGNDVGIELFDSFALVRTSYLQMSGTSIKKYVQAGIIEFDSRADITDSTLSANGTGILAFIDRRPVAEEIFKISNSSITGNTKGIDAFSSASGTTTGKILAAQNWWGSSKGPFHATLNPMGQGDSVSDYVQFIPWLKAKPGSDSDDDDDNDDHDSDCDDKDDDHHDSYKDEDDERENGDKSASLSGSMAIYKNGADGTSHSSDNDDHDDDEDDNDDDCDGDDDDHDSDHKKDTATSTSRTTSTTLLQTPIMTAGYERGLAIREFNITRMLNSPLGKKSK